MYEEQDCYDKAIQLFGTRVSMICAMEMAKKLDAETAYANIKFELKELKKVRKLYNKNKNCDEECKWSVQGSLWWLPQMWVPKLCTIQGRLSATESTDLFCC